MSFHASMTMHNYIVSDSAGDLTVLDAQETELLTEALRKILRHIPPDSGGCSLSADVDLCKRAIRVLAPRQPKNHPKNHPMKRLLPLLAILTLAGCSGRAAPKTVAEFHHANPYAWLSATHTNGDSPTVVYFYRDAFPRISASGHYETEKRLHELTVTNGVLVGYKLTVKP